MYCISKERKEGHKFIDADSMWKPFTSSETSSHKDSQWHFVGFVKVLRYIKIPEKQIWSCMVNSSYCDGRAAYLQTIFHNNLTRDFSLTFFYFFLLSPDKNLLWLGVSRPNTLQSKKWELNIAKDRWCLLKRMQICCPREQQTAEETLHQTSAILHKHPLMLMKREHDSSYLMSWSMSFKCVSYHSVRNSEGFLDTRSRSEIAL